MVVKKNFTEIPAEEVYSGAKNTTIRWLIAEKDGAKNYALRYFEVRKDGYTPYHNHDWEHEVFVLEGKGKLITEEGEFSLNPGDFAYVQPNIMHQFKNSGDDVFKFLCIIPIKK